MFPHDPQHTEARFLHLLTRAFDGWKRKIAVDFSEQSYTSELTSLATDDVYRMFGLAVPEYVLIRLMGRVSISIGRRLGELYDNLPKFVAAARFGLDPQQVAAKVNGLNLDVCIPFALLSTYDRQIAIESAIEYLNIDPTESSGLGIEIRYNFNPNDSARLRKDISMVRGLKQGNLIPIYLVYSGISPRDEAIQRLRREGWHFLIAQDASDFTKSLLGLDLAALISDGAVQSTITVNVNEMMLTLVDSFAFQAAVASADERRRSSTSQTD